MPFLDVLTVQILELTPEVPLYAATVSLARLKRMQESLAQNPGTSLPTEAPCPPCVSMLHLLSAVRGRIVHLGKAVDAGAIHLYNDMFYIDQCHSYQAGKLKTQRRKLLCDCCSAF